MRSIVELRARRAYAADFEREAKSIIIDACEDVLEVADLLKKLLGSGDDRKFAPEVGFDLKLSDDTAARCHVGNRARDELRATGAIARTFSKRLRREGAALVSIVDACERPLRRELGGGVRTLLAAFASNVRLYSDRYRRGFARMTFDDGTGVAWNPEESEEKRALWDADLADLNREYDCGDLTDEEHAERLEGLGKRP